MKRSTLTSIAIAATLSFAGAAAQAQGHPPPRAYDSAHWRFDDRYHHDHYYPRYGYVAPVLPGGAIAVAFRGGNYFYHGGVWFRPVGGRFVVIAPPIGIFVPVLPPSYATLWIGGAPYYYANGTYYAPGPDGYEVVAAPPGADTAQVDPTGQPPQYAQQQAPQQPAYEAPPQAPSQQPMGAPVYSPSRLPPSSAQVQPPQQQGPMDPIIYPRNNQSAQQTEADRQDCNRWATSQPGSIADASVFQRSVAACLDGRGYTVR